IRALRNRPNVPGEEAALVSAGRASARLSLLNDLAAESAIPHVESNEPPSPEVAADGAINAYKKGTGGNQFVGLLWLATLTTRPRMELARRLFALPATKRGDVKILAPAIVDYGYW